MMGANFKLDPTQQPPENQNKTKRQYKIPASYFILLFSPYQLARTQDLVREFEVFMDEMSPL